MTLYKGDINVNPLINKAMDNGLLDRRRKVRLALAFTKVDNLK